MALPQPQLGLSDSSVTSHCWTPWGFPFPAITAVPQELPRAHGSCKEHNLPQHTRGSACIPAWHEGQCKPGPGWDISLGEHTWQTKGDVGWEQRAWGAVLQGIEKCPTSPVQPGEEFDSGLRQGAEGGFKA